MNRTIQGVIHGKTIELMENPGLADGQSVQVVVRATESARPWGDGIRKSAGTLAGQWNAEDDTILEEIYQDRKRDSRREIP